jgi:hypothetical protein
MMCQSCGIEAPTRKTSNIAARARVTPGQAVRYVQALAAQAKAGQK